MRLIDADKLLDEKKMHLYYHLPNGDVAIPIIDIEHAQTVENADYILGQEKQIDYQMCADSMLKIWIENVLSDAEYNRIIGKLNQAHKDRVL